MNVRAREYSAGFMTSSALTAFATGHWVFGLIGLLCVLWDLFLAGPPEAKLVCGCNFPDESYCVKRDQSAKRCACKCHIGAM